MAIPDKIGAANKINELLSGIVKHGGLRLKYRITVDPPMAEERDWERPEILVEFSGPDSPLLLGRGAELLRAIELLAIEMLRLPGNAASVAAEKVRKSGAPYQFAPMSSRERRIVHLALRDHTDLRTESQGDGLRRYVVVYPKDYKSTAGRPARKTIP